MIIHTFLNIIFMCKFLCVETILIKKDVSPFVVNLLRILKSIDYIYQAIITDTK